jgi:hypothetical protein
MKRHFKTTSATYVIELFLLDLASAVGIEFVTSHKKQHSTYVTMMWAVTAEFEFHAALQSLESLSGEIDGGLRRSAREEIRDAGEQLLVEARSAHSRLRSLTDEG